MTRIFCCQDECIWYKNGFCERKEVTIDFDRECEDFEGYRESYKDSYWIACARDGEKYRRLVKNGKKVEYNGYTFYTDDRITADENYNLIEERTGIGVGSFGRLKAKNWDKFLELISTFPDVLSYPIKEERSNENV